MMMASTRSTSLGLLILGLLAGASTAAGCQGELSDSGDAAPAGSGGGGTSGGQTPCTEAPEGPALPQAFIASCGGCHNPYGASTNGAPDLFAFAGSAEDFRNQARQGGDKMPAFDAQTISDADLQAAHAYFSAGAPAASGCDGPVVTPGECSGVSGDISVLYPDAPGAPHAIATRREDGTIVLEAAGRVRGRHERDEAGHNVFLPRYFENRSYRFIIEDTIPAGGNAIKVTWLPITPADNNGNRSPNFRGWYTGQNALFAENVLMTRVNDMHWEYTTTRNARDGRPIQMGDLFEVEFGVFFPEGSIEGQTSYYTDTFRYRVGTGELTPLEEPNAAALSGGQTTITPIYPDGEKHLYYEQMALNIQGETAQDFLEGRRLFHTDFTTGEHSEPGNPLFIEQANKAGPIVNQRECASCHVNNGRGAPPEPGQPMKSMVVKLFGDGEDGAPSPSYGRQLQDVAIGGVAAEGTATLAWEERTVALADGTSVTLRKPNIGFGQLTAGPIARHSVRIARPVIGMGLLEAISEGTLLERADGLDCNRDGISGRPNVVPDPVTGALRIGRFGWKAGKVSVAHQVADALVLDLGVTTSLFPEEDCGDTQASCRSAMSASPELSDEHLGKLTAYMRMVGVPPRRDTDAPAVVRGEELFGQLGCANCHAPTLKTGETHPLVELRGQLIHPYTDLLLHDMGEELADASTRDLVAEPSEWRTPPLWGIGLIELVNGEVHLLHDGRARSFTEAVLWHGGEAQAARDRFVSLPREDRDALLAFLGSL